jgi:predicted permease
MPPRVAERLLRRALPSPVRDFIMGDLEERYRTLAAASRHRADLWYWRQTAGAWIGRVQGAFDAGDVSSGRMLMADLRSGFRSMARRPGQSLAAVLTLGLGIGVVATAFSILYGTVLRGLPFDDADRLVHFERANLHEGPSSMAVTPHDYLSWRRDQSTFEDLGAYVEASATLPVDGAPPERFLGVRISANAFRLLRVEPAVGRTFTADEDRPGAPPVALLSHDLWTGRFGGDPGIVGRDIRLDGVPTTVVGVMEEGFGFPIAERFWLPLRLDAGAISRGQGRLDVFGRLEDGVTMEAATQDFGRIAAGLAEAFPDTNEGVTPILRSFHDEYVGEDFTRTTVRMLLGAFLVLLVCCANVANLLLIRGVRRRRDLALRMSLGATRGRIVRQLVTEAALLAVAGALMGVCIAAYGVAWFDRAGAQAGVFALPHGSDSLFWWDVRLDPATLGFVVAVTGGAALAAGVVPALWASRTVGRGTATVRSDSGAGSVATGAVSRVLVMGQVVLTTALLVIAGLVTRSAVNVAAADDAIATDGVYAARVDLPFDGGEYGSDELRVGLAQRLVERLEVSPELTLAAAATSLPLSLPHAVRYTVEGADPTTDPVQWEVGVVSVSPSYFDVFGVAPLEGRAFDRRDGVSGTPVALVNRSFAERHFPGASPLGARVRLGEEAEGTEPWVRVVGVVPDLWSRPLEPHREPGVYLPIAQAPLGSASTRLGRRGLMTQTVVVRARGEGRGALEAVRAGVYATDRSLPVRDLRLMEEEVRRQMGRYRVWGRFYLTFAVAGLLLAGLGVYGVLTFSVAERTGEIGVRRALGASAGSVRRRVMGTAVRQIGVGALVGLVLGAVLSGGVGRILYGVDPGDPVVFFAVAVSVVVTGMVAAWVPAHRASRVDPMEAIRR